MSKNGLVATLTIPLLCDGHAKQEAAIRDLLHHANLRQVWTCSRRAGKTYAVAIAMMLLAMSGRRKNIVYIALTRDQAFSVIMAEIFIPLLEEHAVKFTKNLKRQSITFTDTGSTVSFGGSDDLRHVRTLLGNRLSFVCIDEGQDQDPSVLKRLVTKILPPALSDEFGRMLVCGVWPDAPLGFYYRDLYKGGRWLTHTWAQLDNPHLENPKQAMADYLAETGLTEDDPQFRRDWKGEEVWDSAATAWSYNPTKNAYKAVRQHWERQIGVGRMVTSIPPTKIDCVSLAVDPGGRDRFAIQCVGWNSNRPTHLWHVAEYTSPKNANMSWDQASEVVDVFAEHLPIAYYFYDAGSSTNELALFSRVSGKYLLKAAAKTDKRGQVRHLSNLLRAGRFHVIAGSELEVDFERSDWDQNKLALGQYEWSSDWHPDPADAARYAAQAFFAVQEHVSHKTPAEKVEAQIDEMIKRQAAPADPWADSDTGFVPGEHFDPFNV